MHLTVKHVEVGPLPTNCYIVQDTDSGDALVVDPGQFDPPLLHALESMGVQALRYILLTHGHFDHILGVQPLKDRFGGDVVIFESEEAFLKDDALSVAPPFCAALPRARKADVLVHDGDRLPFGSGEVQVLHTPGHTSGSVCFLLDRFLFTGDTLFCCSIGRTDLPTGNILKLNRSIRRLAKLDGDYTVLPGHMDPSTLEFERENNPYLS